MRNYSHKGTKDTKGFIKKILLILSKNRSIAFVTFVLLCEIKEAYAT